MCNIFSQFNKNLDFNTEKKKVNIKFNINNFKKVLKDFDEYIDDFKEKYIILKKMNFNIFIFNYNDFKENNKLILDKVCNFINIENDNLYHTHFKKKKYSLIEIFNENDIRGINDLKSTIFKKKYDTVDSYIRNL